MRESVIYQEMQAEAEERVIQREQQLILRQLTRRLGNLTPDLTERVQKLPVEQLEALGEALLDFNEPEELVAWLEQYS